MSGQVRNWKMGKIYGQIPKSGGLCANKQEIMEMRGNPRDLGPCFTCNPSLPLENLL